MWHIEKYKNTPSLIMWMTWQIFVYVQKDISNQMLEAVHNCQRLNKCTKHTLSKIHLPPSKVYTNVFQMENVPWKM